MIPQAIISRGGGFNPRMMAAAALCLMGMFLAAFSFGAPSSARTGNAKGLVSKAAVASPSQGLMGAWSIVDSPNATRQQLSVVSCVSASDCWAVGHYYNPNGVALTLIEHWNGNSWTIASSPNAPFYSNHLTGVACNSTVDCWAVGFSDYNDSRTLIEHWDGVAWSIVASPNSAFQFNDLSSVTCASTTDCWAVGRAENNTLIEHWNGGAWSIVTSPSPGTQFDYFYGVTCVSSSDCWAVGFTQDSAEDPETLIEHWDGTAWSIVASPNPSATLDNVLTSVTCDSASSCWAVGYYISGYVNETYIYQTLIEHWDGSTWSIFSSPNSSTTRSHFLNSVTCASASQCWAVGFYFEEKSAPSLIEHWDGIAWSIVADGATEPHDYELNGVTCTSSSNCWAVGSSGERLTLIQHWDSNGWSRADSPDMRGGGWPNQFYGIACNSGSDCWAVGMARYNYDTFNEHTLIEHWDGNAWSIVDTPFSPHDQALNDVTCTSASDCWAVGYDRYYTDVFNSRTLIQHWDGNSWSIFDSPNPAAPANSGLNGVTCTSESDCWAVGSYADGQRKTLVEHWDGNSWTIIPSPNASPSSLLRSVACSSATDCWAVGYYTQNNDFLTLAEHWDGSGWTVISSPNPTNLSLFNAVDCVSSNDCWAVGYYSTSSSGGQVIEHWNGSAWSIVASPASGVLDDVTCTSGTDCWAVGTTSNLNAYASSLHWDGTTWSSFPSANVPSTMFHSVVCLSNAHCWAAGEGFSGGNPTTHVEEFAGTLRITSASRSAGHFSLTGLTVPNASVNIQASPDLIAPFVTIDTVTANANGAFEYIDLNSSSFQKRFYRAVFP